MQRTNPLPQVRKRAPAAKQEALVRVYVWELPVRLVHWTIFLTTVILSVTGYYIHNPFIISRGPDAFLMATMRFIHEVTAFVFTLAFLVRVYWFFMGNQYAHWRAFVPLTRSQWAGIRDMLKYYLFLRWRAPEATGHNPLAALVYLAIYLVILVQILTGFALFQWVAGTGPWTTLFGWMPGWLHIQYIREIHFLLMFIFFAFTIHHVYSALLVAAEEKNGLMGSIFSGYKFIAAHLVHRDGDRSNEPDREPAEAGPASQQPREAQGVAND